jgi:hypothetical protein
LLPGNPENRPEKISLSWVKEGALALVAKKIKFCRGYQPMT